MVSVRFLLPVLHAFASIAGALGMPTSESTGVPSVTLDYGTFQGACTAGETQSFLGIPFAEPPVGQLRFNKPVPPKPLSGTRNVTQFGNACPQQLAIGANATLPNNPAVGAILLSLVKLLPRMLMTNTSEDCLYLNVVRPAGVSAGHDLPVVIWIYGGAFEIGDASGYNGTQIVSRSVDLKMPVIYVSFNYRLNAFGFLGGKEVKAAGLGNLGLLDQRLALEWVQKYIFLFGGDPQRVILWGQSAGAMSVMLQMVAYDGQRNGLFQGAVMESGSVLPNLDIAFPSAQANYDLLVDCTNCTAASDTLDCLRRAPYDAIYAAVQQTPSVFSYQGVNVSWTPRVDGVFLKRSTRQSLIQGKYAQIPAILGDVDDEGTVFSLLNLNVTTNDEFLQYVQTEILVGATEAEIKTLGKVYPEDPALGSPYDVGTNDTLSPEYKRMSSFQGDLIFQAARRYTLHYLSQTQDVWSYLWKRNKYVPALGSFHGSDLQAFYNLSGGTNWLGTDALVNFAYTLDPNVPAGGYPSGAAPSSLSDVCWPQYLRDVPRLLTLEDPDVVTLTEDTFREASFKVLNKIQCRLGW